MCTSIVYRIRSINEYPAGNHHHHGKKSELLCVLVILVILDNNYFSRNNINQEAEYNITILVCISVYLKKLPIYTDKLV